jgi:hypothetical protein
MGKKQDALSFDKKILKICREVKINCTTFTDKLSQKLKYQTHFVKDGHMYPSANVEYGKLLGEYLIKNNY